MLSMSESLLVMFGNSTFIAYYIYCGILHLSMISSDPPTAYCHNMEVIGSTNRTLANTTSVLSYISSAELFEEEIEKQCSKECPPTCERISFTLSLQWEKQLSKTLDGEFANMTYVEFYLDHRGVSESGILTLVEVNAYSFTELINNVGGTLGLFIGGTIMTVAQVILFFVNYCVEKKPQFVLTGLFSPS